MWNLNLRNSLNLKIYNLLSLIPSFYFSYVIVPRSQFCD